MQQVYQAVLYSTAATLSEWLYLHFNINNLAMNFLQISVFAILVISINSYTFVENYRSKLYN